MITRRAFLKYTGGTALTLFAFNKFGIPKAIAQIPGGTLDLTTVPKFQTPLLIPPVMPTAGKIVQRGGKNVDYYEISVRQFQQQILSLKDTDDNTLNPTTVWGYGAVSSDSKRGLLLHNAPSLTIEAKWSTPVRVKWINELMDANGNYLPHLVTVDPTLHWANPSGGTANRDTRPSFTSTPGPYTGPVPIVTHLHGAVGVGDESDGYAEAWSCPLRTTSRLIMPQKEPGTISSQVRLRPVLVRRGVQDSRPSNTRTRTAPRPSGTTTTS